MPTINLAKLILVTAAESHFLPLLAISQGLNDGLDYLPNFFHAWLKEEKRDPTSRRSVVLTCEDGKVLGFQTFKFQNSGKRVLAQALRIDPTLKGLGVGRKFIDLCRDLLKSINKEIVEVKSIFHRAIPKSKHYDPAMGTVIGTRVIRSYEVADLIKRFLIVPETIGNSCNWLTALELSGAYSDNPAKFEEHFLLKKYFPINWIPYHIENVNDLFKLAKNWEVLVLGTRRPLDNLSILTPPWRTTLGVSFCVDLFVDDKVQLKQHIRIQLAKIASVLSTRMDPGLFHDPSTAFGPLGRAIPVGGASIHVFFSAPCDCFPFLEHYLESELEIGQLVTQNYGAREKEQGLHRERPEFLMYEKKL